MTVFLIKNNPETWNNVERFKTLYLSEKAVDLKGFLEGLKFDWKHFPLEALFTKGSFQGFLRNSQRRAAFL